MKNHEMEFYNLDGDHDTVYHKAFKVISDVFEIHLNMMSLEVNVRKHGDKNWQILNLDSLLIMLRTQKISISDKDFGVLIRSSFVKKYNPIIEYFESLPEWDEINHIKNLCSFIKTDDNEEFEYQLEKWLTRAVKAVFTSDYSNKHCFVLTSQEQHIGKSSFFRYLTPNSLKDYFTESLNTDKDSRIKLAMNFIINLDELAQHNKKTLDSFKSMMSLNDITDRLPYGKKQERLKRMASFTGSTNKTEFLIDETGNVRWIVFEVESIDFKYSKEVDINKVWAQAYFNAHKRKNYNPELSGKDIKRNELRNQKYSFWSKEKELIYKYFKPSENKEDFMTATDVILELQNLGINMNLSKVRTGKALTSLQFNNARHEGVRGYYVTRK